MISYDEMALQDARKTVVQRDWVEVNDFDTHGNGFFFVSAARSLAPLISTLTFAKLRPPGISILSTRLEQVFEGTFS